MFCLFFLLFSFIYFVLFLFFFSALCGIFVHCTHTNTILLFTPPPLALVLRSDAVAAAVAVFRVPPVAADHVKINLFLFVYPSVLILTNNKIWFLFPTFIIIIFSPTNHYTTYYLVNAILIYFLLFILFLSIGKTNNWIPQTLFKFIYNPVNILQHSQMVTPDALFTLFGMSTSFLFIYFFLIFLFDKSHFQFLFCVLLLNLSSLSRLHRHFIFIFLFN